MHPCSVCGKPVPRARLMCRLHWAQVPVAMQRHVWATWSRFQNRATSGQHPMARLAEYRRAADAATECVAALQGADTAAPTSPADPVFSTAQEANTVTTAPKKPRAPRPTTLPDGYMQDAQGRLVATEMVKPIDITRDELVREMTAQAKAVSATLAKFKGEVFAHADSFVALSAAQYGASLGGKKGNVTLHSFDGRFKVLVAIAENITFDERLQAAKALIDACIHEWAENSRPEIKVLVGNAFATDKEGKLNTGRILGLRRLEIEDKRWLTAMKAISDSLQVVGSKRYVRFYERVGDSDQYQAISLDLASV
jgi:hypothetical protein